VSRAPPTFACRVRARVWTPRCPTADAPQRYYSGTCHHAARERKSESRHPPPPPPSRAERGQETGATPPNRRRATAQAAMLYKTVSRSRAPPSVASKGKRLGATPPDVPHQCSTSRDAVRERKSEPRTGQPRIQSEHKSLGDTPPNRGRAAAVQAVMLCEKRVSRSCAPPTPTLACRARARSVRHPAQPQTRRDAVQERKSELRAAHSRVQRARARVGRHAAGLA